MTHQIDVARGRDTVARWCALAEQRLEYLTELFETGRWRRFHSELAFLENIQEAKTAVEIWRDLSLREASRDHSSVDIAWLGRTGTAMPCRVTWLDPGHRMQPRAAAADNPPASIVSIVPETDSHCSKEVRSNEVPSLPATKDASEPRSDMAAIAERYPLLRIAL
ncbi:MAG TPA: TIGR03809 family protein [Bradyrhizobium sp.]